VNELAMNLAAQRVDHGYLKVLIVAEALVAEVLGNFSAMPNRFRICLELDPDCISMRDTVFHIEEKLLHAITSEIPIRCVRIRSEFEPATNSYVPNSYAPNSYVSKAGTACMAFMKRPEWPTTVSVTVLHEHRKSPWLLSCCEVSCDRVSLSSVYLLSSLDPPFAP
jgi:hypothetical protein